MNRRFTRPMRAGASVLSPKPPWASAGSFREGQHPHASASADSESSLVARSSAPAFSAAQTNTQATTAQRCDADGGKKDPGELAHRGKVELCPSAEHVSPVMSKSVFGCI
jgi:hypothetical protein